MKKIRKIFMAIFLITVILASTINISNATDYGATMKLTSNATTTKVGNTVTFTLSLLSTTNVDGVATVHAKINYDKEVLEYVSCEAVNSWSAPVYNQENQEFVTERADVMKPTGDIIKITFKVISEPSSSTTTVSITNFDVADTENEITVKECSAELTIEKKQTENNKPSQDDNETTQKPSEDNNSNSNTNVIDNDANMNNKNDNTTQTGKIPQTGEEIIIPITISIVAIIACIFIVKYKKLKEIK